MATGLKPERLRTIFSPGYTTKGGRQWAGPALGRELRHRIGRQHRGVERRHRPRHHHARQAALAVAPVVSTRILIVTAGAGPGDRLAGAAPGARLPGVRYGGRSPGGLRPCGGAAARAGPDRPGVWPRKGRRHTRGAARQPVRRARDLSAHRGRPQRRSGARSAQPVRLAAVSVRDTPAPPHDQRRPGPPWARAAGCAGPSPS